MSDFDKGLCQSSRCRDLSTCESCHFRLIKGFTTVPLYVRRDANAWTVRVATNYESKVTLDRWAGAVTRCVRRDDDVAVLPCLPSDSLVRRAVSWESEGSRRRRWAQSVVQRKLEATGGSGSTGGALGVSSTRSVTRWITSSSRAPRLPGVPGPPCLMSNNLVMTRCPRCSQQGSGRWAGLEGSKVCLFHGSTPRFRGHQHESTNLSYAIRSSVLEIRPETIPQKHSAAFEASCAAWGCSRDGATRSVVEGVWSRSRSSGK